MARLEELKTVEIKRNPRNPRLDFPQDELDRLAESISNEGILVPVVVFEEDGEWHLIDGERRWLCAQTLGLEEIPAIVVNPASEEENLVQMFNIHMVREPWADMPTAWALRDLTEARGTTSNVELADITGLSLERIKRLRHALDLPDEYQGYIHDGTIPLNFFWELKTNVIGPMARQRPTLFEELGAKRILDSFVSKRLEGTLTNVVALRQVRPMIAMAAEDVSELVDPSVLDETLRDLVNKQEMTIEDAYDETIAIVVETDKLAKRADNIVRAFERLLDKAQSDEEANYVCEVASDLQERLSALVANRIES